MVEQIEGLFVSVVLLLVVLEGFCIMLRGVGVTWSPIRAAFRQLGRFGGWLVGQGAQIVLRIGRAVLEGLGQAIEEAWRALRRAFP